ncbi:MAG: 4Fe-4S binding protein [bacterium]|nr:4Fe-4S binding protein [bacterium]
MNMTPKGSPVKVYFNNVLNGISSMFEGMSITLASMFTRAQTVQYPEVDPRSVASQRQNYKGNFRGMPENYRGLLDVEMDICTACLICMRACPIDCIVITNVKCDKRVFNGRSGKKAVQTRAATRFDIDLGKCMFCGLCTLPCPTGAIFHTNEFAWNKEDLDSLVKRFVDPETGAAAQKRAEEIAQEEIAAKAAKAAAKEAEPSSGDSSSEES